MISPARKLELDLIKADLDDLHDGMVGGEPKTSLGVLLVRLTAALYEAPVEPDPGL